ERAELDGVEDQRNRDRDREPDRTPSRQAHLAQAELGDLAQKRARVSSPADAGQRRRHGFAAHAATPICSCSAKRSPTTRRKTSSSVGPAILVQAGSISAVASAPCSRPTS